MNQKMEFQMFYMYIYIGASCIKQTYIQNIDGRVFKKKNEKNPLQLKKKIPSFQFVIKHWGIPRN